MRVNLKPSLAIALLLFVMAGVVQYGLAQTFSASIAGTVTDPTGSVVSGAKIHLRNMATNDTRDATSTNVGTYKFDNLLPATYELTAEATGFKTFVRSNMILRATTAATVDVPLALGPTEQQVTVSASAVLLDTATANNTASLDSQTLQALPNSYRNPLNFVFSLAGTTEGQAGLTTRSGTLDQMGSMFGLNGGRTGSAQILIDGAPSTAVDWGGLYVAPNNDAVQEFQIVENVYDAQYERSGSGVVTLITKSGGQSYHGSVYDYMRNSALDANSWWNNDNGFKKSNFHRNQFGGTFSGPIPGSKHLFFFAAYEGLRQPQASPNFLTVPTDAERGGDFSGVYNVYGNAVKIYNPFSTHLVTSANAPCAVPGPDCYYTRDQFAGNIIPSGMIDSTGQSLVNLYPHANGPNLNGTLYPNGNFSKVGSASTINDKIDWRIDWEQSSKNRLFARMSDRIRQNVPGTCYFCNGADSTNDQVDHGVQFSLNDTYTPSPTWVIDLSAGYGRWYEAFTRTDAAAAHLSDVGLSSDLSQIDMTPLVSAGIYSGQGSTWADYTKYVRTGMNFLGNVTKQFTRHTLKFGANYDISFMNNRADHPISFDFGPAFTSCEPDPNNAAAPCHAVTSDDAAQTSGDAIASMLLGTGNGAGHIIMDPAMSLHTFGLYIQDQWRVNDRLTVTAGLRYENQRPATERFNRLAYFNPNAVNPVGDMVANNAACGVQTLNTCLGTTLHGAFEYASSSNRFGWGPDNRNFAPRLGIAYKITDRLVARVGAGMFYSPTSAMISFDQPGEFIGFSQDTPWISSVDGGYTPTNLASNPLPTGLIQPVGSANGAMTLVGDGAGQIWPAGTHKIGYTEQWSADVQYEITNNSVLQVGYMGSRGRRLMYGNPDINADQLPTSYLAMGQNALDALVANPFYGVAPGYLGTQQQVPANQLLRPFPQFTYLGYARSLPGASSQYDSLNVKFTKHFSNGLSLLSSYVYSRALDDGSEDFIGWAIGGLWTDSTNTKRDYTVSMHDVPHSFATQFYYQLPFGHGKKWGNGTPAVVNKIVGNWEISGVVRLATGQPLFTPFSYDYPLSKYGFPGYAFENVVGNPTANQSVSQWINPNAFQKVNTSCPNGALCTPDIDALTLPDTPSRISSLRDSGTRNVDFGVFKVLGTERFKFRFGAEFLNLFNHPTYGGLAYSAWHWWGGGNNIDECVDCGSLGKVYGTRNDPRNIQLSLKFTF